MRKVALSLVVIVVAIIVGSAILFVWAMQREIDVSTPQARAQQVESMVLGCKVRLPELIGRQSGAMPEVPPEQAAQACACAADRIISGHAVNGRIKPLDVPESEIDAAELACFKESVAQ